uniref:Uncharacterized protein n=1 Tax=Dicentrarchus labrax TaxID=13489 RepID=A0A8C4DV93_DICLA
MLSFTFNSLSTSKTCRRKHTSSPCWPITVLVVSMWYQSHPTVPQNNSPTTSIHERKKKFERRSRAFGLWRNLFLSSLEAPHNQHYTLSEGVWRRGREEEEEYEVFEFP